MHYYSPQADMFSLRDSSSHDIDTTRAWFRVSKVAPINQWVRALTSEPILFEQPASYLPPADRFVQVAYKLRYIPYQAQ